MGISSIEPMGHAKMLATHILSAQRMENAATLITVLSACLTPLVAIVGGLIAYRQWRTAQSKLKLDLFDKRVVVYEATRRLMSEILTKGYADDAALRAFLVDTRGAKWLFNDDIERYVDKCLYGRAVDLQTLKAELEGVGVGPERTLNVQKQREIKDWVLSEVSDLDSKFEPFLRLSH